MQSHSAFFIPIAIAALMASGCGNTGERTVPKPQAYHRISVPDSIYTTYSADGVSLPVNADAVVSDSIREGGRWLDISYPQFPGSKLFLTITDTDASVLPALIENRTERIRLNTAGAPTELTELTSDGGWKGALFVTRSSLTTPLHILAHNPEGDKLLSGALYISPTPSATPDSIAPIVSAVARDLLTTLKQLK